jgi:prepilin-type N-terminal cleavage/methylation domain-containing protein
MPKPTEHRGAFTLVELLVVIGIIAILIGILIPVVGRVRISAQAADTRNFVSQLSAAIERYHGDFNAYPGPVPNNQLGTNANLTGPPDIHIYAVAPDGRDLNLNLTGAENLALGLCGGLFYSGDPNKPFAFDINRTLAAKGPQSLNAANPKQYAAYMEAKYLYRGPDPVMTNIAVSGFYSDDAARCLNTSCPEFVDQFASPMPIIYMRANIGATGTVTIGGNVVSKVVSDGGKVTLANRDGQYDLSQIGGYTKEFPAQPGRFIGVGKTVKESAYKNVTYPSHGLNSNAGSIDVNSSLDKNAQSPAKFYFPYEPYAYFTNPAIPNTARNKDGYILISAGPDRVYGTNDDICNFGAVIP